MRLLWITSVILPDLAKEIGKCENISGGWLFYQAKLLSNSDNIYLAVATIGNKTEIQQYNINGIQYYLLPSVKSQKLESIWIEIINLFNPDIVHIHGTEFDHGLSCIRACPNLNYVISMQGLTSVISRYVYAGISTREIIKNITFRDLVRFDTLFQSKRKFEKKGELEKEYLRLSHHVIGRTTWDKIHALKMNPNIQYHFCNESLRSAFYSSPKWDKSNIRKYSVFLSQAIYSIKGLHQVLKAISILKPNFPDIQLRIAGTNYFNNKGLNNKLKLSGYGSYINAIVKKERLDKNIIFCGPLEEKQMINEYLSAHVFVCPSSIENSSNSLGEAQILGVPAVASFVGGIPDMIVHGKTGFLYRFEEVEMLAFYIQKIFTDDSLTNHLSVNEIKCAQIRHNTKINLEKTLNIYKEISNIN